MNLLLVSASEIADDRRVMLTDRRADHLRKVLKVEPGRRLRVGRLGGAQGTGTVLSVTADAVELEVAIDDRDEPRPDVDLILGLPRPQALHRVLQTAAVMGIGRLDLVNAWRVEKSFFQSPSLADDAIRRHLLLGAEQGRRTWLPETHQQKLLVPFVRGLRDSGPTLRLIADPESELTLEQAVRPALGSTTRFVVAVGPEGGWIDRELRTFQEEAFIPVSLGPWILRVENAVTAVLAQLDLLRRSEPSADRDSV